MLQQTPNLHFIIVVIASGKAAYLNHAKTNSLEQVLRGVTYSQKGRTRRLPIFETVVAGRMVWYTQGVIVAVR